MRSRHRHDPHRDLVGFTVGTTSYAVPIRAVREITLPLRIDRLPQAPPAVIGVADYRGAIVAVVDLRIRFWDALTERYIGSARRALGDREAARVSDEGQAIPFDDAMSMALSS